MAVGVRVTVGVAVPLGVGVVRAVDARVGVAADLVVGAAAALDADPWLKTLALPAVGVANNSKTISKVDDNTASL